MVDLDTTIDPDGHLAAATKSGQYAYTEVNKVKYFAKRTNDQGKTWFKSISNNG